MGINQNQGPDPQIDLRWSSILEHGSENQQTR